MYNVCVTNFRKLMTRGRQLKSEKLCRKRTRNYSEIIAAQAQSRKFDVLKRHSGFNWSSTAKNKDIEVRVVFCALLSVTIIN